MAATARSALVAAACVLAAACSTQAPPDAAPMEDAPSCAPPDRDVSACGGMGAPFTFGVHPCDLGGRLDCFENAQRQLGDCAATYGVSAWCIQYRNPAGEFVNTCLHASECDVGGGPEACRCGDSPACPHGQVCVSSYPGQRPWCSCAHGYVP